MKKVKRWTGLLALLFFASCGDITDSVKDAAAQKTCGKARVTLSVNSSFAKTIMPVNAGESDFTKIELTAKKFEKITDSYEVYDLNEEDSDSVAKIWLSSAAGGAQKSAYQAMTQDSVLLDCGNYIFTLNLYTDSKLNDESNYRLLQSATLGDSENAFAVTEDTTSLAFAADYVQTTGDLALTFMWEIDSDSTNRIGKIEAGLFTVESKARTAYSNGSNSYDFEALSVSTTSETSFSAEYSKSDLQNGTYYLKYRVYDSTGAVILNTILDVVKIQGYKTEKTITLDLEKINALQRNASGVILLPSYEDSQLRFNCEPKGKIYLNQGSIQISASDPAGVKIDTSAISAKLFYGGTELDSSFYEWFNDGFVLIGTGSKLVSGGTYQLYVTATATVDSKEITESALFEITVENKEYHSLDVSEETYTTELAEIMKNLQADTILVVSGTGTNTTDDVSGTMAKISTAIDSNNNYYTVDLDYSGLTGVTLARYPDFSDNMISSIILPETIDTIEEVAFGSSSSDSNRLKSVTLPAGVTSIASGAFGSSCQSLEKIIFTGENTNYCTNEEGTILYEKGDGDDLTLLLVLEKITDLDFENDFPEVTSVAGGAFGLIESFESVKNFGNVTLQNGAFSGNEIKTLTLDKLITVDSQTYPFSSATVKNLIVNFDVTEANYDAFTYLVAEKEGNYVYGMENIEQVTFNGYAYLKDLTSAPSSYDSDNKLALLYNSQSSLKSINFNKGAYVGKYQFIGFTKLESVIFGVPDAGKNSEIEMYGFGGYNSFNYSLKTIDLTGVKSIDYRGFYQCAVIKEVELPASMTDFSYSSFDCNSSSKISKITVAEGNTTYKANAQGTYLTNYAGDTVIYGVARGVESIDFTGTGVKTIDDQAFFVTSGLKSLNLSGVEHVGQQAFYNTTALTSIEWGTTLKSIGNLAFYRAAITKVELPETVIAIASGAFRRMNTTENPITVFTIGGKSASDDVSGQPDNWYMLTGSSRVATWKSYLSEKPTSITESADIVKLPEEGSTVIATIQAAACDNNSSSGSGYYYRLVD